MFCAGHRSAEGHAIDRRAGAVGRRLSVKAVDLELDLAVCRRQQRRPARSAVARPSASRSPAARTTLPKRIDDRPAVGRHLAEVRHRPAAADHADHEEQEPERQLGGLRPRPAGSALRSDPECHCGPPHAMRRRASPALRRCGATGCRARCAPGPSTRTRNGAASVRRISLVLAPTTVSSVSSERSSV